MKYKQYVTCDSVRSQAYVQLLEGHAGGVVCAIGAQQALREENQVAAEAPVKPSVDL